MTDAERKLIEAVLSEQFGEYSSDVAQCSRDLLFERLGSEVRNKMRRFIIASIALPRHDCTADEWEAMMSEAFSRRHPFTFIFDGKEHPFVSDPRRLPAEHEKTFNDYFEARETVLAFKLKPKEFEALYNDVCAQLGFEPDEWKEDGFVLQDYQCATY